MNTLLAESPLLVLLIDDSVDERRLVTRWLESAGHKVESRASGREGMEALHKLLPDVVLLDIQMEGLDGMEVLHLARTSHPDVPVIMLTADGSPTQVVKAIRQEGAYDYLVKPTERSKLLTIVRNAGMQSRLTSRLRRVQVGNGGILGQSDPIQKMQLQLERVAPRDITVMIHGESGTGKELVARSIHSISGRSGAFVALNCAAIPETLQESELFGSEKGAYTNADKLRAGKFEQANHGTIFLDEVAEMSLSMQAKLLRAVQERAFTRIGGDKEVKVDVRIVAATHKDLAAEVRAGKFREDLYFRLMVFEVTLPPLRERGTDILLLANRFVQDNCKRFNLPNRQLAPEAEAILLRYRWPGNVRELQNAMERAVIDSTDSWIRPENLPRHITSDAPPPPTPVAPPTPPPASPPAAPAAPLNPDYRGLTLEQIIRAAIEDALERHKQNVMAACRELDIPRTTMYRKLKEYELRK